jgi:sterol desaturase/sphingolipid hydroxylase (fatty acid hydroxylase superfamily)
MREFNTCYRMPHRFAYGEDDVRDLGQMSLADVVIAWLRHHSIQVYLALAATAAVPGIWLAPSAAAALTTAAAMVVVYPLVEYGLHRWVLHGRFLYKSAWTAKIWKRIHYDHHRNPHDLLVLFGAPYTTLPTIALVTLPLGWLIGGAAGACVALATGLLLFAMYEFCHCIQHLPYTPSNRWLRAIKSRHLAHHFHSEQGNFGITSALCDSIFGTRYDRAAAVPRSPTACNLGYTGHERERYPWVAALSNKELSHPAARAAAARGRAG